MTASLDTSTDWGRATALRLAEETVVWLTTIRADGAPWPNPVWFVWDGATFLVYSTADAAKLRHVRRDPRVTLNLNGEGWGNDIVAVAGEARESDDPPAHEHAAYLAKYGKSIPKLGLTLEEYGARYSVPLRIVPAAWRGH